MGTPLLLFPDLHNHHNNPTSDSSTRLRSVAPPGVLSTASAG